MEVYTLFLKYTCFSSNKQTNYSLRYQEWKYNEKTWLLKHSYIMVQYLSQTFAQHCGSVLAVLKSNACILGVILCEGRCYLQLLDSQFDVAPDSITSVGLFMCNVWTGSAFVSMAKSSSYSQTGPVHGEKTHPKSIVVWRKTVRPIYSTLLSE